LSCSIKDLSSHPLKVFNIYITKKSTTRKDAMRKYLNKKNLIKDEGVGLILKIIQTWDSPQLPHYFSGLDLHKHFQNNSGLEEDENHPP